ncbi:hypothetical protein [Hymenobacter sp. HDW8]|uniref:hypothetical protein n=1 Tax=Hymenobacter sp. HDW8 TaxID=2714932 RepID=UPI0014076647|nr:hypothetical protein [Hymenobacter sp. HDW8]QIL75999.1 hypothetical protein G7064_09120 [Hymenobacter sp. HDW8]
MLISSAPSNAVLSYSAFGALVGQLANGHRIAGLGQLPKAAHFAKESDGHTGSSVLFRSEYPILMAADQFNGKTSRSNITYSAAATLTKLRTWSPRPTSARHYFTVCLPTSACMARSLVTK